jgi:hypothetical protein
LKIFILEKSALENLLTHNVKKVTPIATTKKALIKGVIINPFILNATPDFTSSIEDMYSICKAMNLNADVV